MTGDIYVFCRVGHRLYAKGVEQRSIGMRANDQRTRSEKTVVVQAGQCVEGLAVHGDKPRTSQRPHLGNDGVSSGNLVLSDTVCNIAKSQVTSHAVMNFDSATSFSIQVHSHYEPALFGRTDSNSTHTGKWVGACPADLKPGDVLSPNGVKINMNAVLESKSQ